MVTRVGERCAGFHKADHKEIRKLFRKFQAAGGKAVKTKGKIVGQIIELLTVHTYIENEVMYPEVCALLPDLKDDVLSPTKNTTWPTRPVHGASRHAGRG